MPVVLNSRFDITLDTLRRVAWRGDPVEIGEAAMARIAACRQSFLDLLAREPEQGVYGINKGQGEMIGQEMTPGQITTLARLKPLAAAVSFGEAYPERVVRGIVLARLANFLEGHAAATPRLTQALAEMLNQGPMPEVPQSGQGGPGEILALYPLSASLSQRFDLEPGERGALINGAPCGAALLADAALAARRRLRLVQEVLALAIEAFNAPREPYDAAVGELWGGSHHKAAFQALGALLEFGPAGDQAGGHARHHQAPVSYRIIPAVLGQAHWAVEQAERQAETFLSAVTHNPTYFAPDSAHPNGRCLGTGGFHNSLTAPLLDGLSAVWADLCLLCERLCAALMNGRVSGFPDFLLTGRGTGDSDGHGAVGYLPMAIAGYVEEARAAAQPSFIPACDASVFGQDDVASPVFLAWPKEARAGRCLEASLAVLAVAASQALEVTGRSQIAPGLLGLLQAVRATVPPVVEDRVLGKELQALSGHFATRVFGTEDADSA